MRIKKKLDQIRRDFWAIYVCEHCGHETEKKGGYDDNYFHHNVIPEMECPKCGKKAPEDYKPQATRYPDSLTL